MNTVMFRKELIIGITIGILVCTLGCGVVIRNATPPPAPCSIETLFLDESVIPEEWFVSMFGEPSTIFGWEAKSICFNSSYGGGIQDIYREGTVAEAYRGYSSLVDSFLHPSAEPPEWSRPDEITYQSQVVDHMQLGCSTTFVTGREDCRFIAQYDVYVVSFDATISEVMSYTDFEILLRDIDRRMTECLSP